MDKDDQNSYEQASEGIFEKASNFENQDGSPTVHKMTSPSLVIHEAADQSESVLKSSVKKVPMSGKNSIARPSDQFLDKPSASHVLPSSSRASASKKSTFQLQLNRTSAGHNNQ